MMEKPPDIEEIRALVGSPLCEIWVKLCDAIDMKYEMECTWNSGGKEIGRASCRERVCLQV